MNADPSWKKSCRLVKMRALPLFCAVTCAVVARGEVVLSVAPDENVPKHQKAPNRQKGGINVPKPKDDFASPNWLDNKQYRE